MEYNVKILENTLLAKNIYKMTFKAEFAKIIKAGQFINIKIDGYTLRRPISVSNIEEDKFSIVYKVVGEGTKVLAGKKIGDSINILAPLGSNFPIEEDKEEILLIGGGIGIPPLYQVAKEYRKLNKKVIAVLGFADIEQAYMIEDFEKLDCEVYIATMDGSLGTKGTVIDAINENNLSGFVYSCGPNVMLDAVEAKFSNGYISKEARMACGIGACMACVCKDKKEEDKYHRICKEGPVFRIGEVY